MHTCEAAPMTIADTSQPAQNERRSVRFECIGGLERSMIGLACDVWLADLATARWATLETLKLGTAITRYMTGNRAGDSLLKRAESECQLSREDVMRLLYVMRSYGAVTSFTPDSNLIIILNLTGLQRLRVLEAMAGGRSLAKSLGLDQHRSMRRRCRVRRIQALPAAA